MLIPGPRQAFVVDNVLTPEECKEFLFLAEQEGYRRSGQDGGPRFAGNRLRTTITDPDFSAKVWKAIEPYMQAHHHDEEDNRSYDFSAQLGSVPTGTYVPHSVNTSALPRVHLPYDR